MQGDDAKRNSVSTAHRHSSDTQGLSTCQSVHYLAVPVGDSLTVLTRWVEEVGGWVVGEVRHLGGRWEKGGAWVMWGWKGPQLGQSSYCSCFAFLTISEVSLQLQIWVWPSAGVEVKLGVGWRSLSRDLLLYFHCKGAHQGPSRDSSMEEVGQDVVMWFSGCSEAGWREELSQAPQRQNLVNAKPHPVVSPGAGTKGRWVAVILYADVIQR